MWSSSTTPSSAPTCGSDGISGGKASLLGDYDVLIVDEAHELVDYATNVWGVTIRESTLKNLGDEASRSSARSARRTLGSSLARTTSTRTSSRRCGPSSSRAPPVTDIEELIVDLVQINKLPST